MRSFRNRRSRRSSSRASVEALEERKLFNTDGFNDQIISVGGTDVETYPGVTAGGDAAQPDTISQWHTGPGDIDIVAQNLPAHTRLAYFATIGCNDYGNSSLTVTIDGGAGETVPTDYWGGATVQHGYMTDEWPVGTDMLQHTADSVDMHIHVDCASDKIWHLSSAEMETTTFMSVAPVQGGTADPASQPLEWTISRDAANGHDQNVYFNISGTHVTVKNSTEVDNTYSGDLYAPPGAQWGDETNLGDGPNSGNFMATIKAGQTSVTIDAQPTGNMWTDPNGDEGGLVPRPVTLKLYTPDQWLRDSTNAFTAYWHDAVPGVDDDNATVDLSPMKTTGAMVWYRQDAVAAWIPCSSVVMRWYDPVTPPAWAPDPKAPNPANVRFWFGGAAPLGITTFTAACNPGTTAQVTGGSPGTINASGLSSTITLSLTNPPAWWNPFAPGWGQDTLEVTIAGAVSGTLSITAKT